MSIQFFRTTKIEIIFDLIYCAPLVHRPFFDVRLCCRILCVVDDIEFCFTTVGDVAFVELKFGTDPLLESRRSRMLFG